MGEEGRYIPFSLMWRIGLVHVLSRLAGFFLAPCCIFQRALWSLNVVM